MKNNEVKFAQGNWQIELRERNNHDGYKVWVLHHGTEVFSLDERGFRQRKNESLPESIKLEAQKIWDKLQSQR